MHGAPSGRIKMAVHVRIQHVLSSHLLELSLACSGEEEVVTASRDDPGRIVDGFYCVIIIIGLLSKKTLHKFA